MSKTCPNCGVSSPDNAKFCIECAHDLSDVPVNEDEKSNNSGNSYKLSCIVLIAIVVVVIVAAGVFFSGFGGDDKASDGNVQITFDKVEIWEDTLEGKPLYCYNVNGYISNYPDDYEKYMLKTIYYDSSGKELTTTTEKLSFFKSDEGYDFPSLISYYDTPNYLDVDHVKVQVIKDNTVLEEFNSTVNSNKVTSMTNSTK